uniref:Uncharacterized protein n=1 Tax=Anguilla anguilla TaxID=7936 RepID=A0A0E9PLD1_ANGAN
MGQTSEMFTLVYKKIDAHIMQV